MYECQKMLPKSLYPSISVLKAAYMFLERAYIHIEETEDAWNVHLSPKRNADSVSEEFENELIAQALREQVYQRTKALREILLARAMTSTMIDRQDPVQRFETEKTDISSHELDDILTDWFERYGENN